jgi:hypothetical protein
MAIEAIRGTSKSCTRRIANFQDISIADPCVDADDPEMTAKLGKILQVGTLSLDPRVCFSQRRYIMLGLKAHQRGGLS